MKIFCDLDGTICTQESNYEDAKPIPENIAKINKLFDDGHFIVYWTARGGTSGIDYRELTENQLRKWGCKYNSLRMDKPGFDILYDDKAMIL